MSPAVAGRRVLVTGGAVRLGAALAEACAGWGMDVAVHCHGSVEAGRAVVERCRARGVRSELVVADLTDAAACRETVERATEALGGLDVLVASAANFRPRAFEEIDAEDIDLGLSLNLRAPLLLAQAAAPALRRAAPGRIVLMSDVAGIEPWPRFLVHSVSKAGVQMLTRALAQELAPEVLVNAIAPGAVLMPDGAGADAHRRSAEKAVLNRVGSPGDVVGALHYLLEADYVTGHTLVVDGGRLVRP